eukprot:g4961.t1
MTSLSVCLTSSGPLALILHSISGVLVWNIRGSKCVCNLPHDSLEMLVSAEMTDPGVICCVCWVGKLTSPYLLATGHITGDILTWCLPENLNGVTRDQSMQFPSPLHRLIARPVGSLGSPVHSLDFISGETDGLLVFGGQSQEQPPGLTLLGLHMSQDEETSSPPEGNMKTLPWFGTIQDCSLVPPKGSMEPFDDPVGILVLTEFGNLILHDIKQDRTIPYSMPFQTCHQHCSVAILCKLSAESPLQSLSSDLMTQMGGVLDLEYLWVIAGGTKENRTMEIQSCSCMLLVGYTDGSLRFWNLSSSAPLCFLHIEESDHYQPGPISALEILDDGKLLVVGDERGQVFIFQFSSVDRKVDLRSMVSMDESPDLVTYCQSKGYQLLIKIHLNEAPIRKFCLESSSNLLAILDKTGIVSILNLITLEMRMVPQTSTGGIVDLCFSEVLNEASGVVLFLTDEDSGLLPIDGLTGLPSRDHDWFRPRSSSNSLALYALTEQGIPLESRNVKLLEAESFFWTTGHVLEEQEECEVDEQETAVYKEKAGHSRFISDDVETGALLAAAVAKLAEEKLPSPRINANSMVLLITDTFVRLYSTVSVLASVRAPLHKISFSQSIIWSTVFSVIPQEDKGPEGGLILLTNDGVLHLVSLPALEVLGTASIKQIVNFNPSQSGEEFFIKPNVIEGDGVGGIYVCGLNGELVHFEIAPKYETEVQSKLKFSLYDWELATAAHSASQVQLTQSEVTPDENAVSPGATLKKGMNFFATLGRRARDELDKAMRIPTGQSPIEAPSSTMTEPPELEVLFCVSDRAPPPEIRSKNEPTASFQEPIKLTGPIGKTRSFDITERMPYELTSTKQRTPEEVRAKYGRQKSTYRTQQTTDDLSAIMSENVSKLHERGEKLRNLNDKTEDLVNDAQNFAELAKQLAQQKSKRWWQM